MTRRMSNSTLAGNTVYRRRPLPNTTGMSWSCRTFNTLAAGECRSDCAPMRCTLRSDCFFRPSHRPFGSAGDVRVERVLGDEKFSCMAAVHENRDAYHALVVTTPMVGRLGGDTHRSTQTAVDPAPHPDTTRRLAPSPGDGTLTGCQPSVGSSSCRACRERARAPHHACWLVGWGALPTSRPTGSRR